jgi:hypothetical protein
MGLCVRLTVVDTWQTVLKLVLVIRPNSSQSEADAPREQNFVVNNDVLQYGVLLRLLFV